MADRTEKILLQLELDVAQLIQNTEAAKTKLAAFKTEQEQLNKSLKELETTGQKGSVTYQNLERQLIANKAAQQNATVEIRNYEKQLRLAVAANDAQVGSNDQLKAQLSLMTAEWNALAKAGRDNTEEGKNLQRAIQETTDKLNEQEQSVDNFRRQVGNYEIGVKSLKQQIREATEVATGLTQKFGENSLQAITATKKVSELKEEMDDFNKRVAALNPEQKFAAFAQAASGVAGGFAAAEGAMAVFGEQSELVGQSLLKVQGALAFAQGLKQVAELGDSFKNLRLVIFGAAAAKEADTVATEANAAAQVEGGIAAEELAAGEVTATAATGTLSLAIKTLLIGSGLILLPVIVNAAVEAFDLFGTKAKQSVNNVIDAVKAENEAHKKNIDDIKAQNAAEETAAENSLNIAKAKGAGIEQEATLEKGLLNTKLDGLRREATENNTHLQELAEKQKDFSNERLSQLKGDDLKKAIEQRDANTEEIRQVNLKNKELVTEATKLKEQLQQVDIDTENKQRDQANRIANLKISLLKDERTKELAAEKEAADEKLQELLKDETANANEIALIRAASAQKIKEIRQKFDLQELKERNQLAISMTREGTLERIAAERKAAQTETDETLKNDKLTVTQRLIIQQDLTNKLRDLDVQRLALIEANNLKEVELANRKAQAEVEAQKAAAGFDTGKQLATRLNEITVSTQAAIDAKEREADALKATAQREIADDEQLQQRIKDIDETIAAEKIAIVQQSATDIATATRESNDQRIQDILAQKQLEIEASDPEGTLDLQKQFLQLQEQQEIASAEKTGKSVELIKRKYAKLENLIDKDRGVASLQVTSDVLGSIGALFKKSSQEYKFIATGQAVIDTYLGAQKAYISQLIPGDPTSLVRAIFAAAAATIKGLANVAVIQGVQFYDGGYDSPSGWTGDGNPRGVSYSHSSPRRTIHNREYIIPDRVLSLPHIASFVSNVVEPTRLRKTNYTNRASYAAGGFSDTFFVANAGNDATAISKEMIETTVKSIMNNFPEIVANVRDITEQQGIIIKVEDRSKI